MKLLLLLCLLAAAAWFVPLLMENAQAPCGAVASLLARTLPPEEAALAGPVAGAMAHAVGDGMVAQAVRLRLPQVPPELACVGLYWQATVAPQTLKQELLPQGQDRRMRNLLRGVQ